MGRTSDIAAEAVPFHVCRGVDGGVRCWGNNHFGQSQRNQNPIVDSAVQLSAGEAHTCARLANGTIRCWGYNFHGALGVPKDEGLQTANGVVAPDITGVVDLSAGYGHTCAIIGGVASCWGKRSDGERLDAPASNDQYVGTTFAPKATQVAAGYKSTCVLHSDSSVACAGANDTGQAGATASSVRIRTLNRVTVPAAARVVAGRGVACALTTQAELWCWGHGQVLSGTPSPLPPTRMGAAHYLELTASDGVCAIREDRRTIDCWTALGVEQQGFDEDMALVATVLGTTCALATSGKLYCWGNLAPFDETSTTKPTVVDGD